MQNITAQNIRLYIVAALGLIFAFNVGNSIANENYTSITLALASLLFIAIIFGLGRSIYLLIPICWCLTGKIDALPLPFSVRQLVIMLSSVIFISGLIFKKNRFTATFEFIDLWIFINILYLCTVFFRNPVGVAALGGDRVGGKPYLDVALAFAAYLMLSRFQISPGLSWKTPFFMLLAVAFTSLVGGIAEYFPTLGFKLSHYYSDFGPVTDDFGAEVVAGEDRLTFFQTLGTTLVLLVVSWVNPLKLLQLNNLPQLFTYLSGLVLILLSGFRNAILDSFLYTTVSVIIRERGMGFFKIVVIGVLGAVMVTALSYSPIKIPLTFQRALSFLPGDWDETMARDAQGSSEWRFEMWQTVLTTNRYIHNKMFGDGFGFLRSDYEIMLASMNGQGVGFIGGAEQEAFMIDGDFHSGPVSSIRFVGYVGLALFLPLLFMTARYAYRITKDAYGTGYQFFAFFIGIPIILYPFIFIFIFGDYRTDLQLQLYGVGLLKMLSGSITSWKKSQAEINLQMREPKPKIQGVLV